MFEASLTQFVLKFILSAVLLAFAAIAAFASTYLTARGYGSSQSASAAISAAVAQAMSYFLAQCTGHVSRARLTQSVQHSGDLSSTASRSCVESLIEYSGSTPQVECASTP